MSSRRATSPALKSAAAPASDARRRKKNADEITPRRSSRSAIWATVAPSGISTTSSPDPSPLNGWNSDSRNHAATSAAAPPATAT